MALAKQQNITSSISMLDENHVIYWLKVAGELSPYIVFAALISVLVYIILGFIRRAAELLRLAKQEYAYLELLPPAQTAKSLPATQQLFAVLSGLDSSRTPLDRLLGRKVVFAPSIISTKQKGIRYIWHVPKGELHSFEKTINAYWPEVKCEVVDKILSAGLNWRNAKVLDIKQTGHFAYPFNLQESFTEFDPLAYLTAAMTKLEENELVGLQIIITPARVREANLIAKRMLHNEELIYQLGRKKAPLLDGFFNTLGSIFFAITDALGDLVSGTPSDKYRDAHSHHRQQVAMKIKPARTLSKFEQELAVSVQQKLNQPLFRADMRVLVHVNDKNDEAQRLKSVREWLAAFNLPKYQSLKARYNFPATIKNRYKLFLFRNFLPAAYTKYSALFSTAELTNLYHFVHPQTGKTENVIKSLSDTLPAPVSLKSNPKFDVVLGENYHHGTTTKIGLTEAERQRHVFIIGGTGNGKTTMLEYSMVQDLQGEKGFAFVDPHGDAATKLLKHTPKERVKDVIYFNPDDLSYPIGLNLLELTPGLTGDDLLREKDLVTEAAISVFRKIFSDDDSGGHRIEYVLRNAVQTALTVESPTLFTVYDLLNDPKYRKKVVAGLENKDLKNFWKNEFGKAGGFQQVKMAAGITSKIGRFLFSASAKRIIEQPRSTIDFDDVLNSGKVLICNFSKGLLGEDTSELFGIVVLAKLQMAALRRARIVQQERKPFYVYVDEFQNFATTSFVQMLSEARKYALYLVMAEQTTSQQDEQQMINIILANVGTVIAFRSGSPADEALMLPLFSPYIREGAIANLPSWNFYIKISAINPQEPFSGRTLLLDESKGDATTKVIEASRNKYALTLSKKASPKKAAAKKKPPVKVTGTTLPDLE